MFVNCMPIYMFTVFSHSSIAIGFGIFFGIIFGVGLLLFYIRGKHNTMPVELVI